ncbi:MAG TPA: hypothetical protein VJR27_00240 [Candidatus Saccharimonadales bacterium]|nr:hypothetical protein [Candidatus Saccharimonadales bacterium]
MPGFFEGMKRVLKGQPVFDENDNPSGATPPSQPAQQQTPMPTGIQKYKDGTFPVVYLKRPIVHYNGDRIDVYCYIANNWPVEVLVDKIRIFDTRREIDISLRPHQEREVLVYSGPKITRDYSEALLDYKTMLEGDYFESIHDVRYRYRGEDKTYEISDVRLRLPIRDIYG